MMATEMSDLIGSLDWEVVPVTEADARLVAQACARWRKGVHPARLNYGDCFAYALAQDRRCPFLYVGEDFATTDVVGRGWAQAVLRESMCLRSGCGAYPRVAAVRATAGCCSRCWTCGSRYRAVRPRSVP